MFGTASKSVCLIGTQIKRLFESSASNFICSIDFRKGTFAELHVLQIIFSKSLSVKEVVDPRMELLSPSEDVDMQCVTPSEDNMKVALSIGVSSCSSTTFLWAWLLVFRYRSYVVGLASWLL